MLNKTKMGLDNKPPPETPDLNEFQQLSNPNNVEWLEGLMNQLNAIPDSNNEPPPYSNNEPLRDNWKNIQQTYKKKKNKKKIII